MRRQIIILMTFLLGSVALVSSQESDVESESDALSVSQQMVTGAWVPIELEPITESPFSVNAIGATDSCLDAPELTVPDTGLTITNGMFVDQADQVLACMWGVSGSRGYRTAWYKFIPSESSMVTIDTVGSYYDTVLAVYSDANLNGCNNLIQIACNDDANFFTSRVTLPVNGGHTYYIEVADWHEAVNGVAQLYVSTQSSPFSSIWQIESDGERIEPFRSRHAVVVVGEDIYIISGQKVVGEFPVRTPNTVVFHTAETDPGNMWEELAPMWGPDGFGYSNTTAAYVDGKIYVPSGYIGLNGDYDGTHWVYDIATNQWIQGPENDWSGNPVPIYSTAVPYDRTTENGYFVIGGLTGPFPNPYSIGAEARDEMYFYSVTQGAWSERTWPSLDRGRMGHSAVVQNINDSDHICVAGGLGKIDLFHREALNTVECYDVESDTWWNTGDMNRSRYFHSSAVDSTGDWYVWGGIDNLGRIVSSVEKYDRENVRWIELGTSFKLVKPGRAWSRGDFIDQTLWIVGGETLNGDVVNRIETLHILNLEGLQPVNFVPVLVNDLPALGEPDDTFTNARRLWLGLPSSGQFYGAEDYVDVFYFDTINPGAVTINLTQLPLNSEYILHWYRDDKLLLESKSNLGGLEMSMTQYLTAGRYFVVVERQLPTPSFDPYPQPFKIGITD